MGKKKLSEQQKALLEEIVTVWELAPTLRLGQLLNTVLEMNLGRGAFNALPSLEDSDLAGGFWLFGKRLKEASSQTEQPTE